MKKIKREYVYIAGPYCPRNCSLHIASMIAQHNTDKAIEIGNRIIERGHYVFVPHLSHYMQNHHSCTTDYGKWWYKEDNTFLKRWATALFYISSSTGADAELTLAKKLGLKIYYSIDEVPILKVEFGGC